MAQLTWRGVDAPNFSTSLDGLRTASSLLDKAFSTASGTINGIDQDISARVNKDVLARMAGISEADGAEAEIQQLLASVDPRRLSAETIMFGANRPDTLISRDTDRFNLDTAQYNQNRVVDNNERTDEAEPLIRGYYEAAARGDTKGMATARAGIMESRLRAAQMASVIGEGQDIIAGDLGIENDRFGLEQGRYGFRRRQADDASSDKADAFMAMARKQGAATVEDAFALLDKQGYDPKTYNAIASKIMPQQFIDTAALSFDGAGSGGASGGGSFTGGAGPTAVAATLRSGGLSDAVVAGFLGNFEVEGGYGGAQGDGGSASGIAQWRLERRDAFRQKFGKDPHQATPEQQAQFVLWELQTPEGRKVAGISEQQANAILSAKDPGQAAELIDRFYERSDGRHRGRRVASAQRALGLITGAAAQGRTNNVDNITGDPIIDRWNETVGKNSSVVAVAANMIGKGGVFEGADRLTVEARIRQVQAAANDIASKAGSPKRFSADQAAFFLENSVGERGWGDWLSDTTGIGTGSVAGRSLDENVLEANVLKVINGDVDGGANARNRAGIIEQETAAARAAYERQAGLVQQLIAARANPQRIATERAKLVQLERAITGGIAQQYNEGDIAPRSPRMPGPVQIGTGPRASAKLPSQSSADFVTELMKSKPQARGATSAPRASGTVFDMNKFLGNFGR